MIHIEFFICNKELKLNSATGTLNMRSRHLFYVYVIQVG
jgi:hypothetical protein